MNISHCQFLIFSKFFETELDNKSPECRLAECKPDIRFVLIMYRIWFVHSFS